jgi:hypothetical protein
LNAAEDGSEILAQSFNKFQHYIYMKKEIFALTLIGRLTRIAGSPAHNSNNNAP